MSQEHAQFNEYAKFLMGKHLEEVCQEILLGLRQFDTPLLQLLFKKPEVEAMAWLKAREQSFLEAAAQGAGLEYDRERLKMWETEGVAGIPKVAQDATDMFLFHLAHRRALQRFVSRYARSSSMKIATLEAIEAHYEILLPFARQATARFAESNRRG
jgi:hypothetical protein